jgi:hypothetical protein
MVTSNLKRSLNAHNWNQNWNLIPKLESEFTYPLNPGILTFFGRMYLIMQNSDSRFGISHIQSTHTISHTNKVYILYYLLNIGKTLSRLRIFFQILLP